jgi:serine/threonine protein kinase
MTDTLASTMTVLMPREAGAEPAAAASVGQDALVPGTRLDEFEITRLLGAGGFGVVYLAFDTVLQRHVAIKEYLPAALAGRGEGVSVSMRSPAHAETFALGLESFFNEARLLASFDHPALVKVYRFWKANGTAYMVMPFYPGHTLKETRRRMTASPDEAWLRAVIEPLLGALEVLHRQGVYHRDIAPDNILLLPDGLPVLLDFGAARRVIGDRTQSLTVVLKPNFSPVEQFADVAGMRQGPWTDVYALGATMHFMLTGQAPTPAVMRVVRDAMPALSAQGGAQFPGVGTEFLATIDWSLALAPSDRPQCVATVRQALNGEVVPPPPSMRHASEPRLPDQAVDADRALLERANSDAVAAADPAAGIVPVSVRTVKHVAWVRLGRGTVAVLALTGLGVLGWSAQALGPSAAVPSSVTSTAKVPVSAVPPPAVAAPTGAPAQGPVPPTAVAVPISRPTAARAAAEVPSSALAPAVAQRRRAAETRPGRALQTADATPRSPKAACGDLNFFSLAMCVHRECQTRRWRDHPQCVEARLIEEERQRRMDQQ